MKSFTKQTSVIAIFFLLFGCTPMDLSDFNEIIIPDFSNGWTVDKGTPTGTFFIFSTNIDSSAATGLLEGSEQIAPDLYKVKGSFVKLKVKLSYLTDIENGGDNGPRSGFSYSGLYDTLNKPFRIRLVNVNDANDSLVLRHG